MCNILAMDSSNNPDVISINAASAAISVSDVPWNGPVGAVRLGFIDGEVLVNPTRKELLSSSLNLVVTATKQNLVVMMEGNANNILQQDLLKAIKIGTKEAQHIVNAIEKLQKYHGKSKRILAPHIGISDEAMEAIKTLSEMRLKEIFRDHSHDKLSRDVAVNNVRSDVAEKIRSSFPELESGEVVEAFGKLSKQLFRDMVFDEDKRCDGRELQQLRDISCQVDLFKPLHGSSLFQRGQTQVFCTVTLDSHESAMKLDPVSILTR